MDTQLLITILLPLFAAALLLAIPLGGRIARGVALTVTGVTLLLTAGLYIAFDRNASGAQFMSSIPWLSGYGISFSVGLDGISLVAFLLTALVAFAGVLVTRNLNGRDTQFYVLYLALVGGAFGAFASTNMFFFYFFAEFEVLCSYLLIAGWGRQKEASDRAAMQMTLFVAAGAVLTLLAFMVLAVRGGSFDLSTLREGLLRNPFPVAVQSVLFLMLLAGFGVLISVWPLHVWAPPAYAAAPTAVSMLSAGVLKQLGVYGLLRFAVPLLPEGARDCMPVLAVLAIINILYGGLIALRQKDWKLLISYGAISHAGYILLGISAVNRVGVGGVVVMMFAGALSVALLFALAGTVEEQADTREITRFSGLARRAPFIGGCMVIAALASSGLPGFAGFVGEIMVLAGAWMKGSILLRVATMAGVWGLVLTAVYMLGAVRVGVFGPPAADILKVLDARTYISRLPYVLLLVALLAVGVFPRLLTDRIQRSVAALTATQDATQVSRTSMDKR